MKHIKRDCQIVASPVDGALNLVMTSSKAFDREFFQSISDSDRLYDREREAWRVKPSKLLEVLSISQRHFGIVDGLEDLVGGGYSIFNIDEDTPLAVIDAMIRAYRVEMAPDKARTPAEAEERTEFLQQLVAARDELAKERG